MNILGKSCCFTGHRPLKLPWKYNEDDPRCLEFKQRLADVIYAVYESGVTHFITGMALGCDIYCAEAVLALRNEHPEITLEAAIPYNGQEAKWPERSRRRYRRILIECDSAKLLQENYTPGCMMLRNKYMVDSSSVVIACYNGSTGGTYNTIKYAMQKNKEVIQIYIE